MRIIRDKKSKTVKCENKRIFIIGELEQKCVWANVCRVFGLELMKRQQIKRPRSIG